jgi:hypothetical protein
MLAGGVARDTLWSMSITAIVQNDTIKLPPGVHLPDGTKVRVEPEPATDGNALEWMKEFAGTVEGPPDLATEHDHYAHGTPKRAGR